MLALSGLGALIPGDPVPSFKQTVLPLLQRKCNLPACHANRGASTALTNYTAVAAKGKTIVKRITSLNGAMPPVASGIKISKDEIKLIQSWVAASAPNN